MRGSHKILVFLNMSSSWRRVYRLQFYICISGFHKNKQHLEIKMETLCKLWFHRFFPLRISLLLHYDNRPVKKKPFMHAYVYVSVATRLSTLYCANCWCCNIRPIIFERERESEKIFLCEAFIYRWNGMEMAWLSSVLLWKGQNIKRWFNIKNTCMYIAQPPFLIYHVLVFYLCSRIWWEYIWQ